MGVITIPTTGQTSNPLGLTQPLPDGGSDILIFFRELKDFLRIPLVDALARQKLGIGNNGIQQNIQQNLKDDGSINLRKTSNTTPPPQQKQQIQQPQSNPQQYILTLLATPEGRKSLADGIKNVQDLIGDVRLSAVVKELTEGDGNVTPKKTGDKKTNK